MMPLDTSRANLVLKICMEEVVSRKFTMAEHRSECEKREPALRSDTREVMAKVVQS